MITENEEILLKEIEEYSVQVASCNQEIVALRTELAEKEEEIDDLNLAISLLNDQMDNGDLNDL